MGTMTGERPVHSGVRQPPRRSLPAGHLSLPGIPNDLVRWISAAL